MANRKFIFVNTDFEYEEEAESVSTSSGSGDVGKLATLDANGKWDISFIPDSVTNDRDWKDSVRFATTAALPASTYANGTGGVGATITADANGAFPTTDGVTPALNDYLLVKDQTGSELENGIYEITQLGDGGNPWILTRRTDADEDSEVSGGMAVPIEEGTANGDKYALLTSNGNIDIGVDAQNFALQNTTNLTAGDGIDITSNVVAVDLVADGGLEFATGELQVKFADTSVAADLDGTNGLHAISAQDLSQNGATQGANILGADPTTISVSSATTIQGVLEDLDNAIGEPGVDYTSGGVTIGDLVYVSSNDTVLPVPITGLSSIQWAIGCASATVAASGTVKVLSNDVVISGVISGLSPTAGDRVFWTGSALTLTAPSTTGALVWQVGVAKNASDLHVDIKRIKRNF